MRLCPLSMALSPLFLDQLEPSLRSNGRKCGRGHRPVESGYAKITKIAGFRGSPSQATRRHFSLENCFKALSNAKNVLAARPNWLLLFFPVKTIEISRIIPKPDFCQNTKIWISLSSPRRAYTEVHVGTGPFQSLAFYR